MKCCSKLQFGAHNSFRSITRIICRIIPSSLLVAALYDLPRTASSWESTKAQYPSVYAISSHFSGHASPKTVGSGRVLVIASLMFELNWRRVKPVAKWRSHSSMVWPPTQ